MQYKEGEFLVFDIETNGFIEDMVDYSSFPYKLNDSARIWVVSIRDRVTGKVTTRHLEGITREWMEEALKNVKVLVAHNGIEFDLPALKLFGLIDYKVGYPGESSTVNGKDCLILDSLLFSRLLDPDRLGGHSLAALGKGTGELKTDFRQLCIDKGYIEKGSPRGQEFRQFVPEMIEYCDQDTLVNTLILDDLEKEYKKGGRWKAALELESKLADLGVARSHFGFELDVDLAKKNFKELTTLMQQMSEEVEPLLPPCPLNKGESNFYTPPATQITKSGKLGAHFVNFIKRTGAKLLERDGEYQVKFEGKVFSVPFEEPIKTHREATIDDMDHIKQFLIDEHGWVPSEWRVRDLTVDSKKNKLPYDKRMAAFERWLAETLGGKYMDSRLKIVGEDYKVSNVKKLRQEISKRLKSDWPVRVPTSPPIKVGVAKNLCDNLVKLGSKVEFARSFADYLTYKDRRSNIAGGSNIDEVDLDIERPSSGYLSAYREEDSRIPTRAFTIGTNTFRYSHIGVVNIPRVTSMYGAPMRAMFTAGKGYVQLGFDFSGLESRVQSHYIHNFEGGDEEGRILRGEDGLCPHNYMAEMLGVSRDDAKSIRYGITYGSSYNKVAQMMGVPKMEGKEILDGFWEASPATKAFKDHIENYWSTTGEERSLPAIDGRLLRSRSKHSLVNAMFQSCGVIFAKSVTVNLFKELEKRDIVTNPFEGRPDIAGMIEMHDEGQLAIAPRLIKVETFNTKKEAEEFLNSKREEEYIYSNIGESNGKFYVVKPNVLTRAITDAITKSEVDLKLNVKMGYDWMVGRSWKDCH